ncbi:hypothetical protein Hanom_Chr01g00071051 [Helianthus anomalus]
MKAEREREKERKRGVVCGCLINEKRRGFCRIKQTLFFLQLQTADLWSTSSPANACRCGPQTADLLPFQKQTAPM